MKKNEPLRELVHHSLKKILLIMRIAVFLVFAGFLQIYASNAWSQRTKFSLTLSDTELVRVLDQIEKESDFLFLYNEKLIDASQRVSIHVQQQEIDGVLKSLFEGTGVKYSILGRKIILSPSKEGEAVQQPFSVSGKVTDSSGAPLPGVAVMVKGTTQGTVTDSEGNYSLSGISSEGQLVFSFVGMKTQEIAVAGNPIVNVSLSEETIGVEEVVAIGYGTARKINLTGSLDVVSGEKLLNRPVANTSLLLQGLTPSVAVTLNSYGGEPGAQPNMSIRGIGSISGNDNPLTLVDGVEMNINTLDPSTIESISVLKDASASAVYGSRAAFGVILITTRKGRTDQPLSIEYSNNISFAIPIYVPSMKDSYTYAIALNQGRINAGLTPTFPDDQLERILGYQKGTYLTEYDPEKPPYSTFRGRWDGNANYNWTKMYWKNYAVNQKHNVNVSGGNEKTSYYFSLGYFDQPGLYTWGADSYKRYNALSNISSKINDWARFYSETKFSSALTDYPIGRASNGRRFIYSEINDFFPTMPYHNLDGTIANPLVMSMKEGGRSKTENNDLQIKFGIELEPAKGWKTNISYNYGLKNGNNVQNPKPVWVTASNGIVQNVNQPYTGSVKDFSKEKYQLFSAFTSYERNLSEHYFKAMIGYEQDYNHYEYLYGSKMELITPEVVSIRSALGTMTVNDAETHWATQGIFGRLNYNFDEKYLLEFSARYDGSSRFAEGSRWGFFPSLSAGYNVHKEKFWTNLSPYINTMKLRGSYGSLGNQNMANYLYLATIDIKQQVSGNAFDTGYLINNEIPLYASQPAIISADLTWETVTTLNFGFESTFIKNRLNLTFDWYDRVTSNMIGPSSSLPSILGATAPKTNNAKLSTKGFELVLGWKDRVSSDFSYNAQFSLGDSKTTILEYVNDIGSLGTWYAGRTYGDVWGLVTDGIIQEAGETMPDQSYYHAKWGPGDIKYKDISGPDGVPDGKITPGANTLTDHGDLTIIANTTPRYLYGLSLGANWKNFDLSMFWQGVGKRIVVPKSDSEYYFGLMQTPNSSCIFEGGLMLDYWRPANETNILGPNTDSFFPKPYSSTERNKNLQVQSRYLLNAAYLRLKNLQLGYSIPKNVLNRTFIKTARIYASGENLLTFTPLPKLFEPETTAASNKNDGGVDLGEIYPITKVISFGLNITF